jgi:hypothetical protein
MRPERMRDMDSITASALRLLKFALDKHGIEHYRYGIALSEDDKDVEDTLVLRRNEERWEVYYFEDGQRGVSATFERHYEATRFFFWLLTNPLGQYAYREEFEASDK